MKIYGVAILAACFLIGHIIGDQLGKLFGLTGNLGGVHGYHHQADQQRGWLLRVD